MAVVIAEMGSYIVIDHFSADEIRGDAARDKNVELAISALCSKWEELYEDIEESSFAQEYAQYRPNSRYLEIYHTRVITVNPKPFQEYLPMVFEDKKPKFIVEFDIYTDRYGGALCYINERYYSTVILFEDGSAEVIGPNPLLNEKNHLFSN